MSFTMMFDSPIRMSVSLADGKTVVLDVSALHADGAPPPTTLELTPPKKKAAPPKIYLPKDATDEEARALLAGAYDEGPARKAMTRDRLLALLCFMRKRIFKLSTVNYGAHDAIALTSAGAHGVPPSAFARAIVAAGADEFWTKRGDITIAQVAKNVAALAKAYETKRIDPRAALRSMLPGIRKIDPIVAAGIEQDLATMTDDQIKPLITTWQRNIGASNVERR